MIRRAVAGLGAVAVVLGAVGCGGDKPPPGANDVDTALAAVSDIVFQCRAVEQGFQSTVDEQSFGGHIDALVDAAEEFDLDATFRGPQPAVDADTPVRDEEELELIDSETTLREQIELAVGVLEEECSPEDADRLRDAMS